MRELFDLAGAPAENDWVITLEEGAVRWRYALAGLDNVWVIGGLSFDEEGEYVRIQGLRALHEQIAKRIMREPAMSGPRFRLVRKLMLASVETFAAEAGLDLDAMLAWEAGRGLQPAGAERALRGAYDRWLREPRPARAAA